MSAVTIEAQDIKEDFSLVLGGPLFQIFRRAYLSGNALELIKNRVTKKNDCKKLGRVNLRIIAIYLNNDRAAEAWLPGRSQT